MSVVEALLTNKAILNYYLKVNNLLGLWNPEPDIFDSLLSCPIVSPLFKRLQILYGLLVVFLIVNSPVMNKEYLVYSNLPSKVDYCMGNLSNIFPVRKKLIEVFILVFIFCLMWPYKIKNIFFLNQ
jgi:hypothetical protein